MTDHEAFEEGYDAYWDGLDSDANPYDQHQESEKRNSWEEGWQAARKHDYDESDGRG
jgi:ribosome modulation factor